LKGQLTRQRNDAGTKEDTVAASTLYRWSEIQPEPMNALVTRQYLAGVQTMLARLVLKKGAHVPRHHHVNEQVSHVIAGALDFVLNDERVTVRAGEILCIPPDAPHEVFALEDSIALDIFTPPRQDWIDGNDAYLRGGAPQGPTG
jgi:quercetin dioxygenase-like cupin family protein